MFACKPPFRVKSLSMENKKRLSKALAAAGVASRRAAEEIIFEGRVKVNGKMVDVPQTMVDWEKDVILVDESPIQRRGAKSLLYISINLTAIPAQIRA